MQKNDAGQIAVKRLRQNPKRVDVGHKKFYLFAPKNNICLAWIDPEDVDKILAMRRNCCGNSSKPEFWLASETDVRRYLYGGA